MSTARQLLICGQNQSSIIDSETFATVLFWSTFLWRQLATDKVRGQLDWSSIHRELLKLELELYKQEIVLPVMNL